MPRRREHTAGTPAGVRTGGTEPRRRWPRNRGTRPFSLTSRPLGRLKLNSYRAPRRAPTTAATAATTSALAAAAAAAAAAATPTAAPTAASPAAAVARHVRCRAPCRMAVAAATGPTPRPPANPPPLSAHRRLGRRLGHRLGRRRRYRHAHSRAHCRVARRSLPFQPSARDSLTHRAARGLASRASVPSPPPPRLRRLDSGRGPRAGPGPHLCTRGLPRATGPPRPFDIKQRSMGRAATPPTGGTRGPLRPRFRPAAATAAPRAARHLTPFPPASAAWRRTRQGQPPKNPREAEYECRRRANAGEVLDPLRVHVRRRQETIEGASAAAGHDKNGSLLGFATTDEIGSVMDVTKRRKTKTARARSIWGRRVRGR